MLPTNYARIEQGKLNVTVDTLMRVSAGLGLELTVNFGPSVGRKK